MGIILSNERLCTLLTPERLLTDATVAHSHSSLESGCRSALTAHCPPIAGADLNPAMLIPNHPMKRTAYSRPETVPV